MTLTVLGGRQTPTAKIPKKDPKNLVIARVLGYTAMMSMVAMSLLRDPYATDGVLVIRNSELTKMLQVN